MASLVGDIILFDSVTLPGGTGLTNADFEDKLFQVITVPTSYNFYRLLLQPLDPQQYLREEV